MIAPIDNNIRTFFKGLFTSEAYGYEDPTYLGFSLHFDFDPHHRDPSTGQMHDPLFCEPGTGLESAQEYLKNIGFEKKAAQLKQFKEILRYMNKNAPYFFQGVSGVTELWKVNRDPWDFNPERAFERELKFQCLESVDLRMTALADLYKSATFDEQNMRSLLPENLRWFSLVLRIAEMRSFHKIKEGVDSNKQDILEVADNLTSVIEFKLGHCVFDFEESFRDEYLLDGTMDAMTQSFGVEVGSVYHKSTYPLLNLVVDNFYTANAGRIVDKSETKGGVLTPTENNIQNPTLSDQNLGRVQGYGNGVNPNSLFSGAVSALTSQANDIAQQLASFPGQQLSNLQNQGQSFFTNAALGNVYGDIRNQSLTETLNGFLGGGDQLNVNVANLGDVYDGDPKALPNYPKDMGNAFTGNNDSNAAQQEANNSGLLDDLGNVYE